MHPIPRKPAPDLSFDLVDGERWTLQDQSPGHFTLVIFYRGYHCPLCRQQLQGYEELFDRFSALGVEVVAVSTNDQDIATKTKSEWKLPKIPIGHGLSLDTVRDWGLWISSARKDNEPDRFNEPGLFLVRPDGTLYFASIQSMPFSRASAEQLLNSIEWIIENDYPARGEVE